MPLAATQLGHSIGNPAVGHIDLHTTMRNVITNDPVLGKTIRLTTSEYRSPFG